MMHRYFFRGPSLVPPHKETEFVVFATDADDAIARWGEFITNPPVRTMRLIFQGKPHRREPPAGSMPRTRLDAILERHT